MFERDRKFETLVRFSFFCPVVYGTRIIHSFFIDISIGIFLVEEYRCISNFLSGKITFLGRSQMEQLKRSAETTPKNVILGCVMLYFIVIAI